jgi:hypothetical protein
MSGTRFFLGIGGGFNFHRPLQAHRCSLLLPVMPAFTA